MNTQRTIPRILASLVLTVCCLALAVAKLRAAEPADDRQIALWVMQEGGEVLLDGQWDYIDDPFELPDGPVYIVGVNMHGTVTEAKGAGRVKGRARLGFHFTSLRAGKERYEIQTAPIALEAEATKKEDAKKIGIGAGIGAAVGAIAGGASGAAKGAAIGAGGGTGVVLATKGKEVRLGAGANVTARLTAPLMIQLGS